MFVHEILKLSSTEYIGSGMEDNILPELLGTECRMYQGVWDKGRANQWISTLLPLITFSQTHLPFSAQHLTALIFHDNIYRGIPFSPLMWAPLRNELGRRILRADEPLWPKWMNLNRPKWMKLLWYSKTFYSSASIASVLDIFSQWQPTSLFLVLLVALFLKKTPSNEFFSNAKMSGRIAYISWRIICFYIPVMISDIPKLFSYAVFKF